MIEKINNRNTKNRRLEESSINALSYIALQNIGFDMSIPIFRAISLEYEYTPRVTIEHSRLHLQLYCPVTYINNIY